MSSQTVDDEKPLDPAVARVQRRLRRLIVISGLTLGLGMVAVALALVYRLSGTTSAAFQPPPGAAVSATIPTGATLVSTTEDNGRIVLTYTHAGGTTLMVVDERTLTVIGRLDLKAE